MPRSTAPQIATLYRRIYTHSLECIGVHRVRGVNCRVTASDTNELFPFITGVNYCVRGRRSRHRTLAQNTRQTDGRQLLNMDPKKVIIKTLGFRLFHYFVEFCCDVWPCNATPNNVLFLRKIK